MAFYEIDLEEQVKGKHELWDIAQVVDLSRLTYRLKDLENSVGRSGYGLDVGLKCLYLQFHYDLSDRQMEMRLRFDIAFKWFCGFEPHLRAYFLNLKNGRAIGDRPRFSFSSLWMPWSIT